LGIVALMYGFLLTTSGDDASRFFIPAGVACVFVLPVVLVRNSPRVTSKNFMGPITYRVDTEGIRSTSQFTEGFLRWPAVERFEYRSDVLVLRLDKVRFVPVAVGGLPPDTLASLLSFVQAQIVGRRLRRGLEPPNLTGRRGRDGVGGRRRQWWDCRRRPSLGGMGWVTCWVGGWRT